MSKKYLKYCFISSLVLCSSIQITKAESEIPYEMEPRTVIEYVSDSEFIFQQGGYSHNPQPMIDSNQMEKELFGNIEVNKDYSVVENSLPTMKGLKVYYADDGKILKTEYPENFNLNHFLSEQKNTKFKSLRLPEGVYQIASWGTANNLYYDGNTNMITGNGRATTFSDEIGQGDHYNRKGDIATKLSYDNCQLGLSVKVEATDTSGNRVIKYMEKWDAGDLPDAIIDIWKDGVEYWGYTWNEWFSMPGTTGFEHANIDVDGNRIY